MSQPTNSNSAATAEISGPRKSDFWKLTVGSIGVVYGDIGTSPLYAFKESVASASAGGQTAPDTIIGVVSLILWALMSIVTLKYVIFLLRADNHGEGGTLTLMALAQRGWQGNTYIIAVLGMLGAALFYGDAVITPAISVLSAVEGLKVITPAFEPFIIPLSLIILVGLFIVQKRGTAKVAAFFGPITAIWFLALAIGGLIHIAERPDILAAINPVYGIRFLVTHGHIGFLTLGSVFLAVTGAEALYADLGHFGRRPIQFAWIAVVFPALALNYLGQGAMVLAHPESAESPFFLLYPGWAQLPSGSSRNRSHRHCQPSSHYRRVFIDPTSNPSRSVATLPDPPHLGDTDGANLHPPHQLDDARHGAADRSHVPYLECVSRSLRDRCYGHDGGYLHNGLRCGLEVLELAALGRRPPDRTDVTGRYSLPGCQPC
jgi:K+ potassium transporter integral membrane domain